MTSVATRPSRQSTAMPVNRWDPAQDLEDLHGQMADGEIKVNGQFLFSGHTLELALDAPDLKATNRYASRVASERSE